MTEGDDLLDFIRATVHGRVHPDIQERVVEIVARTVIELMSRPEFTNHLRPIIDLQAENYYLKQQVVQLQRVVQQMPVKVVPARKRAPAKKKAAPRNAQAFKRGTQGR